MRRKQPNILLVMCDQLTAIALSVYGNRVCRTPNIDRLAEQGYTQGHDGRGASPLNNPESDERREIGRKRRSRSAERE